jgi:serine/threonine protein kinase
MAYKAGQKLGNYQLERFLGQGGFAEVYLGKHRYLNTQAAIKVLLRQSNNEALEKFLQEARMIASLKHPHIVRILDFGIEEQHPFLIMAYAPHGTLRQRYRQGKILSPATIAPHVRQVVDALHYAHERKIIHRDVKPENMLLDDDNIVLLSDFGLAMRERSTYRSIHSTDSAGTTVYMAPEQLRGKPCAASDQYALGIVMYEWLCGCLPFDGPDISVVVQHLHEAPAPLREHVPTLPIEIERVVLKALEKNPQQRFATVQELAEAFEEACKDIPLPETTPAQSLKDVSTYRSSEPHTLLQASLSSEFVELLPDSVHNETLPASTTTPDIHWSSHFSSLQAPSLSASLHVQTSNRDTAVAITASTTSSQHANAHISRRTLFAGIAGVILLSSGVGIWRFSSQGTQNLSVIAQNGQINSGTGTSLSTATSQISTTPHTHGTPATGASSGSLPANSNGTGQNGGTSTVSTPSTPSLSNSGNSTATSTPDNIGSSSGITPTATTISATPQNTALTAQINNPPASVTNNTTTSISITTTMSNISFQFVAAYSGFKNPKKDGQIPPDTINGTTDTSGAATVSWTPSITPPGQIGNNTYAKVYVIATDQDGNKVSSNSNQVQIMR